MNSNFDYNMIVILTVWELKDPTLATLGVAIESFLQYLNLTMQTICLPTKVDIRKKRWNADVQY
jgi:hypothetical protein